MTPTHRPLPLAAPAIRSTRSIRGNLAIAATVPLVSLLSSLLAIPPRHAHAHPIFGKGPPQVSSSEPLVDLRESAASWRLAAAERKAPGMPSNPADPDRLDPADRPASMAPWTWREGPRGSGLELAFDMGTRRVPSSHARLAVLELPEPRDLSTFDGLRLALDTDAPREDVEVSVWLREEDGSWYYLKSAVPLVDPENAAAFFFEDLSEAEGVSPTDAHDEDYVLDVRAISHVAIGIVNPLGVGEVRFTVRSLDAVKIEKEPPFLARVAATGTFLSVNGQELVPAGLFGGLDASFSPEILPVAPSVPRDVLGSHDTMRAVLARALEEADSGARIVGVRVVPGRGGPVGRGDLSDTTASNGSYEVLAAHAVTRHGKWLSVHTTVPDDIADAERDLPDDPVSDRVPRASRHRLTERPEAAAAAREWRIMTHHIRDIVYTILKSPDKVCSRTVGEEANAKEASGKETSAKQAIRVTSELFRNLRGRLILTRATDDYVWCVASVVGTDPRAMSPRPDGMQELVVVVFNDYRREREVEVSVQAPAGTRFRGGVVERPTVDPESCRLDLARQPLDSRGDRETFRVTLAGRSAWKVALALEGTPREGPEVRFRQVFSPDIFVDVRRRKPFETVVEIPREELDAATRVWLRCVVEDVAPAEALVSVGGRELILLEARTAEGGNRIVDVPCRVGWFSERTPIIFAVEDGNHAGYRVDMVSLVLESR